ncbi:BatD family protein [Candidatus Omnitrophota bacterium]
MKKVLIAIILILFSNISLADSVDVSVEVDKEKITIGDRIKYEVKVEYDDGIKIEPLAVAENLIEFEIKDYNIKEPRKIKGKRKLSGVEYIITTFTTGEFIIPPVRIRYKDKEDNESGITSDEIKINVEAVKRGSNDKDDIRGLKAPVGIKERFPFWLFIVLMLVFIVGGLIFVYFKNKRSVEDAPVVPSRSPEEIAENRLKSLLDMRLVEKGMVKEYYIRLSDIVRNYIEDRYKIFALDKTTWEVCQEMKAEKIARSYVDKTRDFLDDSDLVKFAKYIPTQKEIEEACVKAKEIVGMRN